MYILSQQEEEIVNVIAINLQCPAFAMVKFENGNLRFYSRKDEKTQTKSMAFFFFFLMCYRFAWNI